MPNIDGMMAVAQPDAMKLVKGVIVTLRGGAVSAAGERKGSGGGVEEYSAYHFVSRYFAPWNGINEDPVTG